MKKLGFQQFDLGVDFRILFGMWNSLVMSYPCAKFHHDMIINYGITYIFHVFSFVYFWTNDKGLSIMTSFIPFMQIFFHI